MELVYDYNSQHHRISLSDSVSLTVIRDEHQMQEVSLADLERELTTTTAEESLLHHPSPLVVVNDGYRTTPTERVLTMLNQCSPGFLERASLLVSTGTHGAPTEQHLLQMLGVWLPQLRGRIVVHDCRDREAMVQVGTDRFGLPYFLNRKAAEAQATIVIGSVEPHYFAGLTGGRKSFFPGLTDFATIERNHNMAASLDCRPLRLAGNPVAEHLAELMDGWNHGAILSLQAVLDSDERMVGLFAGSMEDSFSRAVTCAETIYAHQVRQPFDLVIAELSSPLDRNLYQAQKGLENCQAGVRDGGTIVILAACPEGIGSDHFFQLADIWEKQKNEPIDGVPRFGSHKLSRVNALSRRITVLLHSLLPEAAVRKVFYEPSAPLELVIRELCSRQSAPRIALVRNAGHAVLQRVD